MLTRVLRAVRLATDEVFVGRPRRLQLVTDAIHWQRSVARNVLRASSSCQT